MDSRRAKNFARKSRAGGPGGSAFLPRRRLLSKKMSEAARQRESVLNKRRDRHGQLASSILEALDQL
jgi:hypothetical protein